MTRLPPSLPKLARHNHPCLPLLLRTCRDLESTQNELRWLREHAENLANRSRKVFTNRKRLDLHADSDVKITHRRVLGRRGNRGHDAESILHRLCKERGRGKPLQYVIGNTPFGDLEILCERGALIPRPETESITTHLASLLYSGIAGAGQRGKLRILDLCTGTGCIPLLLHSLLHPPSSKPYTEFKNPQFEIQLCGVDISPTAIKLARKNLRHNIRLGNLSSHAEQQIRFVTDDIFHSTKQADGNGSWRHEDWHIVISNPPYISTKGYDTTTAASVRKWEPKLALVPDHPHPVDRIKTEASWEDEAGGDAFYPKILDVADDVGAKMLLVEVADITQAARVVRLVQERRVWKEVEVWMDWPGECGYGARKEGEGKHHLQVGGERIEVKGKGNGRAVFVWR